MAEWEILVIHCTQSRERLLADQSALDELKVFKEADDTYTSFIKTRLKNLRNPPGVFCPIFYIKNGDKLEKF